MNKFTLKHYTDFLNEQEEKLRQEEISKTAQQIKELEPKLQKAFYCKYPEESLNVVMRLTDSTIEALKEIGFTVKRSVDPLSNYDIVTITPADKLKD